MDMYWILIIQTEGRCAGWAATSMAEIPWLSWDRFLPWCHSQELTSNRFIVCLQCFAAVIKQQHSSKRQPLWSQKTLNLQLKIIRAILKRVFALILTTWLYSTQKQVGYGCYCASCNTVLQGFQSLVISVCEIFLLILNQGVIDLIDEADIFLARLLALHDRFAAFYFTLN